jgi:hypothetical protein
VTYLVDTNVVSEANKRRADAGVTEWFAGVRARDIWLSVLVIGEIRAGIERLRRRDRVAAQRTQDWLDQLVATHHRQILPITQDVAEVWGSLNVPQRLPTVDALLAATALVHDLTLVTRNVKDVASSGVRLLNPFHG